MKRDPRLRPGKSQEMALLGRVEWLVEDLRGLMLFLEMAASNVSLINMARRPKITAGKVSSWPPIQRPKFEERLNMATNRLWGIRARFKGVIEKDEIEPIKSFVDLISKSDPAVKKACDKFYRLVCNRKLKKILSE